MWKGEGAPGARAGRPQPWESTWPGTRLPSVAAGRGWDWAEGFGGARGTGCAGAGCGAGARWGASWKGLLGMGIELRSQPQPGAEPAEEVGPRPCAGQVGCPGGVGALSPSSTAPLAQALVPSAALPLPARAPSPYLWLWQLLPGGEQCAPGLWSPGTDGVLGQGWPHEPALALQRARGAEVLGTGVRAHQAVPQPGRSRLAQGKGRAQSAVPLGPGLSVSERRVPGGSGVCFHLSPPHGCRVAQQAP